MKIAIASGKGGTGKTTVSTGLFYVLSRDPGYTVQLMDCDVEEPDCHLFIPANEKARYPVHISIPYVDKDKCIFCGRCKTICAFNAIVLLPDAQFIEIADDMCHGCGACYYICDERAMVENKHEIGSVTLHHYAVKDEFTEGRMKVGSALQTKVIKETIRYTREEGVILYDSPPGTSCPVIAVVSRADYVILVTEPTPFGLHDLKLMAETVKALSKKHGVIINKAGLRYPPLYDYLKEEQIPLLGEIPFSRDYAKICSKGMMLPAYDPALSELFQHILTQVMHEETL